MLEAIEAEVTSEFEEQRRRWEVASAKGKPRKGPGSGAIDRTMSDIPLQTVYGPEDLAGRDLAREIGWPGQFPFTRGLHPNGYRDRLWTMRLTSGFATARETNERYKFLIETGQTGISIAFDMPTLMGYDSDAMQARGEVGHCGVAIDSLQDMETLFAGIDMAEITTNITMNGPASIILAFYIAAAEKKGIPRAKLGGTLQADILKEYIAQKEWIFPPGPHMRIITDVVEFCTREMPKWNTISISGYHIREAGSSAVQELAFTLADAFAYTEACMARGLDIDAFAPRFSFFFDAHIDFFEEIAKFRVARRIYAKRMRDKYGAKDPRSWQLRFHTQTAGCSATAQQPENNIVRIAYEAMAAVLGGTQSLHTNGLDEVLALPTEKAVEIALRTQQVLAYETNVTNVVDPLGGAYFIEALTDEMERQAESYFSQIEEFGGVLPAIEAGFFQREIADASYRYQRSIENNDRVLVGLNAFVKEQEKVEVEIFKVDDTAEKEQVAALAKLRATRDYAAARRALDRLEQACRNEHDNIMPHLLNCANTYCTQGEMVNTMVKVYGRYIENAVF